VKIDLVFLRNPANKEANKQINKLIADENITSLTDVTSSHVKRLIHPVAPDYNVSTGQSQNLGARNLRLKEI